MNETTERTTPAEEEVQPLSFSDQLRRFADLFDGIDGVSAQLSIYRSDATPELVARVLDTLDTLEDVEVKDLQTFGVIGTPPYRTGLCSLSVHVERDLVTDSAPVPVAPPVRVLAIDEIAERVRSKAVA